MSLKRQFSDIFELPEEIVMDAPLIMLADRHKFYLENHKGVALYRENGIKVRLKSGFLQVTGTKLHIDWIEAGVIKISGNIRGLEFIDRTGDNR